MAPRPGPWETAQSRPFADRPPERAGIGMERGALAGSGGDSVDGGCRDLSHLPEPPERLGAGRQHRGTVERAAQQDVAVVSQGCAPRRWLAGRAGKAAQFAREPGGDGLSGDAHRVVSEHVVPPLRTRPVLGCRQCHGQTVARGSRSRALSPGALSARSSVTPCRLATETTRLSPSPLPGEERLASSR